MLFHCFVISLLFLTNIFANKLDVNILCRNAILINAKNGKIIFEKRSKEKIYPASLTKIATLLFVLEKNIDKIEKNAIVTKNAIFTVSPLNKHKYAPYVLETDGSNFNLKEGEVMSLVSMLYALMLKSGNDCANVIAKNISKDIFSFMEGLNVYIKSMGLKDTTFLNPHGLHHKDHMTTCMDMAILCREALKNENFKQIVSTDAYWVEKTNKHPKRKIKQYNHLLDRNSKYYYPFAIGIKTGYHSRAKFNLAAVAKKGDRTLIAILMGANSQEERYLDAKKLFEKAFLEKKVEKKIFCRGKIFSAKVKGAKKEIKAYLKEDAFFKYFPSEYFASEDIKAHIKWKNLSFPIKKDAHIADLFISDGLDSFVYSIYSKELVEEKFFYRIFKRFW